MMRARQLLLFFRQACIYCARFTYLLLLRLASTTTAHLSSLAVPYPLVFGVHSKSDWPSLRRITDAHPSSILIRKLQKASAIMVSFSIRSACIAMVIAVPATIAQSSDTVPPCLV